MSAAANTLAGPEVKRKRIHVPGWKHLMRLLPYVSSHKAPSSIASKAARCPWRSLAD
jgi:hypothetical protein